ncbi:TfoX/Sxy family protein [Undibacterium sp. RuTC16W]|uniref:TfoX/Sxy family protein n=1 Tax=Undibacterium sp. RuTC16W TaxID=3413048 RepID=UPI003BF34631
MASQASSVEFIVDQLSGCGAVTAKRMFGEYGLYLSEKMFAVICDDQLFIKPTDAGRAFLGTVSEAPPYPSAKPWFLLDADMWEDRERLCQLALCTVAALPVPVKKVKKQKPPAATTS